MKKVHLCSVNSSPTSSSTPASSTPPARPLVVGLTGGMAAGKSTVARMFRALGAEVWDADAVAKSMYRTDGGLRQALSDRWGEAVIQRDGTGRDVDIVRAEVAKRVFQHSKEMAWLEAQIHPAVGRAFRMWLESVASLNCPPYVVREAAILFESKSHVSCDVVVTVEASEATRVERALNRARARGEADVTEADVLARMRRQWSREQRVSLADEVLENEGNGPLMPSVLALHDRLLAWPR